MLTEESFPVKKTPYSKMFDRNKTKLLVISTNILIQKILCLLPLVITSNDFKI